LINMIKMSLLVRSSAAMILMLIGANAAMSDTCRSELEGRAATLLVAHKPGGGYDNYARAIAPVLSDLTGLRVRVVNNSAGGGVVARELMLAASDDSLTMLIESAGSLSDELAQVSNQQNLLELMDVLGIVHRSPSAWVLGEGLDIYDTSLTNLVAARGTLDDSHISVTLAGMALGIETEVVGGYGGSSEFVSAVLREEVDFTTVSIQTALRRTKGNEAHVALVLSDRPNSDAPDVPYLAGPGGVVLTRAAGLSDEEIERRTQFAEMVVTLSGSIRGIYISNAVSLETRDCLRQAMTESLLSDALSRSLADLGRPLDPLTGDAAIALLTQLIEARGKATPLLAQFSR